MSIKNHQRQTKNLSPEKLEQIKQKSEALNDQSGKTYINTKVNNKKAKHIQTNQAKLKRDASTSKIESPKRINQEDQTNKNNAAKSLNRSKCLESKDFETDNII